MVWRTGAGRSKIPWQEVNSVLMLPAATMLTDHGSFSKSTRTGDIYWYKERGFVGIPYRRGGTEPGPVEQGNMYRGISVQ